MQTVVSKLADTGNITMLLEDQLAVPKVPDNKKIFPICSFLEQLMGSGNFYYIPDLLLMI